jgi:hypothetical protein
MAKVRKIPRWILSDRHAVDVDQYQWILYQRIVKKNGSLGGWKAKKFYPRVNQLLEHLMHQTMRDTFSDDVDAAITAGYDYAQAAANKFSVEMDRLGLNDISRPSLPPEPAQ